MATSYVRPPAHEAVREYVGGPRWSRPFEFRDGRIYYVENIIIRHYDKIDKFSQERHRISCCTLNTIEHHAQCPYEIEVNFWPPIFDRGLLSFEDEKMQFSEARRVLFDYLATARPQRRRSEYQWPVQVDYELEFVLKWQGTGIVQEERPTPMRIVFLDIDGVLNNVAAHQTRASMNRKYMIRIAPECVQPLEWLIQQTGAQIVLSTSHRTEDTEKWTECLREIGVPSARVIGATPDLVRWPNNPDGTLTRGHEIDAWLEEAQQMFQKLEYVILDDSDDMAMHADHLVRTDLYNGLTMTDAERAAQMLLN